MKINLGSHLRTGRASREIPNEWVGADITAILRHRNFRGRGLSSMHWPYKKPIRGRARPLCLSNGEAPPQHAKRG